MGEKELERQMLRGCTNYRAVLGMKNGYIDVSGRTDTNVRTGMSTDRTDETIICKKTYIFIL